MHSSSVMNAADHQQRQLAKHCFWDEFEQTLYIDARKLFPKEGVVTILGWDNMMMNAQVIPQYPSYFKIMSWSNQPHFSDWRKQIPKWVQDSCGLFPSHQMTLLHYAGKYPQVLELLDHAPMLAWRLVASNLEEPEIVAMLSGKRTQIAGTVGWPGKAETVKFLTNLRLRMVNQEIAEQIDTCLFDEQRLTALQSLPRINSMALSLAARFPDLIGSQLHHALAQLPCRPMQCQSMVALLEDAYRAAEFLNLPESSVNKIGQCRYLVEVSTLYQAWLNQVVAEVSLANKLPSFLHKQTLQETLTDQPTIVQKLEGWLALTQAQQHIWLTDLTEQNLVKLQLVAWQDSEGLWGALLGEQTSSLDKTAKQPTSTQPTTKQLGTRPILRVRGLENCLAGAKQLSALHLWQASQDK